MKKELRVRELTMGFKDQNGNRKCDATVERNVKRSSKKERKSEYSTILKVKM